MKKLRTAVIGAGKMGKIHAKVYSKLDSAELVAVADNDIESAEALAEKFDCQATADPASPVASSSCANWKYGVAERGRADISLRVCFLRNADSQKTTKRSGWATSRYPSATIRLPPDSPVSRSPLFSLKRIGCRAR